MPAPALGGWLAVLFAVTRGLFSKTIQSCLILALLASVACSSGKDSGRKPPPSESDAKVTVLRPLDGDLPIRLEEQKPTPVEPQASPTPAPEPALKITTETKVKIFAEKSGVLEPLKELPVGSVLELSTTFEVVNIPHRNAEGQVVHSTTGFIAPVKIVSGADIPDSDIKTLNETHGGLHVFASLIQDLEGASGTFSALKSSEPGEDFLKRFEASGKPKFSFPKGLKERFGSRLNKTNTSIGDEEKVKWIKIFTEIQRAVNRERPAPRDLLIMKRSLALFHAIDFELHGKSYGRGAWSIAVTVTARRHGFARTPCAEFVSEVLRQAYFRAGYKLTDDFNAEKKNVMNWKFTASVEGLSDALVRAGWLAWSTDQYRPPVGAVMLHEIGETPGHVYLSAGAGGTWIVDNGSPHGRDLRKTKAKTLGDLYKSGAFMLPPGMIPERWEK